MKMNKIFTVLALLLLTAGYVAAGTGCHATEVISFNQGLRKDGGAIEDKRSDPTKALGAPQGGDIENFVALGFGGELILKFDCKIMNPDDGIDLSITETSYGNPTCANYPEKARISVSQDGNSWTDLGQICQDGAFDLGQLNWVKYVKIVDETDKNSTKFPAAADGYDVDGLTARTCDCNIENLPEFTSTAVIALILFAAPVTAYVIAKKK